MEKKIKEKVLVIGTRNKKGIIRKIKWLSSHVVISEKQFSECLRLKEEENERSRVSNRKKE